jgi:hypothetical protein
LVVDGDGAVDSVAFEEKEEERICEIEGIGHSHSISLRVKAKSRERKLAKLVVKK